MRRFSYRCEPCDQSYETLVAGTGAPSPSVRCCACGRPAQREWVAPTVFVSDSEVEYKPRDFVKVSRDHDPHRRNAKQIQRETDAILRSKRKHARRAKLGGKKGMRWLGSIDAREFAAYSKRAGSKDAFFENPREALKRTGNLFD